MRNRVRVALPIENPPHSHKTISLPMIGTAEARLVMTVAPQNDIWPQGNTYPRKAVPINVRSKARPMAHTFAKR